jgi:hypothetical protein
MAGKSATVLIIAMKPVGEVNGTFIWTSQATRDNHKRHYLRAPSLLFL